QPTERVDVNLTAHYGKDESELIGSTNTNGDRIGVFTPPTDEPHIDYDNVAPATDTEQYGGALRIDVELGDVTLTSITGHNRIARTYAIGDFVPVRVAEASFDEVTRSVSQEVRATSQGAGSLRWMVGASY